MVVLNSALNFIEIPVGWGASGGGNEHHKKHSQQAVLDQRSNCQQTAQPRRSKTAR